MCPLNSHHDFLNDLHSTVCILYLVVPDSTSLVNRLLHSAGVHQLEAALILLMIVGVGVVSTSKLGGISVCNKKTFLAHVHRLMHQLNSPNLYWETFLSRLAHSSMGVLCHFNDVIVKN